MDIARQQCPKCQEILKITITCHHEETISRLRGLLKEADDCLANLFGAVNWARIKSDKDQKVIDSWMETLKRIRAEVEE